VNNTENAASLRLPMLALRGMVIFPKTVMHFDVGRKKSIIALNEAMADNQLVYLAAQQDIRVEEPGPEDLYQVGVVAEVRQVLKMPNDTLRVLVEGLYRARAASYDQAGGTVYAMAEDFPAQPVPEEDKVLAEALMRTAKDLFEDYCYFLPKMSKDIMMNVLSADDPAYFAEYLTGNVLLKTEEKQSILEDSDTVQRLHKITQFLEAEINVLGIEHELYDKVKEQVDKSQREYFLREQMRVISEELDGGEYSPDEIDEYLSRIEKLKASDEVKDKLNAEVIKLQKTPPGSHEGAVLRGWLDTCLDLPWGKFTKDKIDIEKSGKILDRDHFGLEKVKDRILELLAVRKLAPDIKGQIICLAGPPGVGKTSIAKSIAKAMGRKYTRVSLGGVRDESDIRGHRKTYVGAMPGRMINAVKAAGSANPLILLDEIDKMGNDFRGDPSAAMLEVLDAEQNVAFRDHYLEVPFDLSQVLFITTANDVGEIPVPLRDRMEIINLPSYTREEKFQIGKRHLLKKQMKRHGLTAKALHVADAALYDLIDSYTREAGVRSLEREIAALCRKTARKIVGGEAEKLSVTVKNLEEILGPRRFKPDRPVKKDEVGVVTGLAWTAVGGETMPIEVAVMPGSGKTELTGSLGKVMQESARAAISFIRSNSEALGVDGEFYKNCDIHIHAPEGAIPKDGPSAGVTMVTALVSALTGKKVHNDVAMTGEVTLRGRVLPIGGLREKTMAAYAQGIKTVVIPADNEPDLAEVDQAVKESIRFVIADHVDTVLRTALIEQ
jgi:ATP-dependent Lon protease